ncbi:MAG: imidazole glycerol phosphate synthase subunit HisH [Candidatus Bipolaricaulota bacterium]|nr:imidazole glycerol phosphate synthase subunit HisH [Candidatus Bipolaricaulota bacterium]MBS3791392.1 imidazole glycerol phosphate synthase subunit HisH [Candidatus Bipolaricaulota bacterium]
MIAIVDLGIGNFASVKKALDGNVTVNPDVVKGADKIVLPGVGNFGEVAKKLKPLRETILRKIEAGTPFLGICLGMHLLFPSSSEGGGEGLGVLAGDVSGLPREASPHIGWNQVFPAREDPLLSDLEPGSFFYFVHSYYPNPEDESVVTGKTEYETAGGIKSFPATVRRENVFGVQFHPEKSSKKGLKILENFKQL